MQGELAGLQDDLHQNPALGVPLGRGFRKIRLAVRSKGRGKSGGMRIITYLVSKVANERIYLTSIYDKSELSTITDRDLVRILKTLGLP